MKINNVSYSKAVGLLQEADVLLYRGTGPISYGIKKFTQGNYSHVALASSHKSNGDKIWSCVEFREWAGGRSTCLRHQVDKYPGRIDVYRAPDIQNFVYYSPVQDTVISGYNELNSKAITSMMLRMTGLPYGWSRIWWIFLNKALGFRLLYSMTKVTDDELVDDVFPVCSTAVAMCYRLGSGIDLVKMRSDQYTSPNDIARSPALNYLFTLESD